VSYITVWSETFTYNTAVSTSRSTDDGLIDCIVEGTLVYSQEGYQVKVEDLLIGQSILTLDGGFNTDDMTALATISTTQVNSPSQPISTDDKLSAIKRKQAIGIIDFNNGLLKTTANHWHIVKRDGLWKVREANAVRVGDFFHHIDLGEIEITSKVEDATNTYTVYKIDVEPNDVFFANGILTHNRKEECADPSSICDPGSVCYNPCDGNAWRYGCDRECGGLIRE
tara:strand:- start:60 stop:737 length:678 start_codon:yes stop_codon:yes gene_type:complete